MEKIDFNTLIEDCIIDEKNKMVILKFRDGNEKIAIADDCAKFNPKTGILWAFSEYMLESYWKQSAYNFVQYCITLDAKKKSSKTRCENKQNSCCEYCGKRGSRRLLHLAEEKAEDDRDINWNDVMLFIADLYSKTGMNLEEIL